MASWNPWHGCHKLSEGCRNCYVYRIDGRHGKDSSIVSKTKNFDLPVRQNKKGSYHIPAGQKVWTCFSSDFFVEDADSWRPEAWKMMRERQDLNFLMITKRIDRFDQCIPDDWGDGYDNVTICCTVENQDRADYRLPIYRELPIKHKIIICEPILERIDLEPYLDSWVEQVVVGGESGKEARKCHYNWILEIREKCQSKRISFWFKQTGTWFIKDDRLFYIQKRLQHSQARKAGLNIDYNNKNMKYFYGYPTEIGKIYIREEDHFITGISFHNYGNDSEERETTLIKKAIVELNEYLAGTRKVFDLPLRPQGTDFQKKVWNALIQIPYGEVRSYGEIAAMVGNEKAARAVGLANNRNPILIVIPCHRVIGKNGDMVGYGAGIELKTRLLKLEKDVKGN